MLCNEFCVNLFGNVADGLEANSFLRILVAVDDQISINLDEVRADFQDCGQVGISGAKVVNGNLYAELSNFLQEAHELLIILDLFSFQDFKCNSLTGLRRQIPDQCKDEFPIGFCINVIGRQIQEHGFCAVAEQAQYLSDHLLGKLQVQVIILGNFQELSR